MEEIFSRTTEGQVEDKRTKNHSRHIHLKEIYSLTWI
jgi:hypothetical protein